jgi:hypothetical protein
MAQAIQATMVVGAIAEEILKWKKLVHWYNDVS